uniref:Uncharacterized protein n=1 Tax=Glossina pallidipes TaxID=7398 RepID=A0A1A9ZAN7_GLOPL
MFTSKWIYQSSIVEEENTSAGTKRTPQIDDFIQLLDYRIFYRKAMRYNSIAACISSAAHSIFSTNSKETIGITKRRWHHLYWGNDRHPDKVLDLAFHHFISH